MALRRSRSHFQLSRDFPASANAVASLSITTRLNSLTCVPELPGGEQRRPLVLAGSLMLPTGPRDLLLPQAPPSLWGSLRGTAAGLGLVFAQAGRGLPGESKEAPLCAELTQGHTAPKRGPQQLSQLLTDSASSAVCLLLQAVPGREPILRLSLSGTGLHFCYSVSGGQQPMEVQGAGRGILSPRWTCSTAER